MGGSGLQWSFSNKPSQMLSFKPSQEGGGAVSHSVLASYVQGPVPAEKRTREQGKRQTQNYEQLVKTSRMVSSPLKSPFSVGSNGQNGAACRTNLESLGSSAKMNHGQTPPASSNIVGSTNLSGDSTFYGPAQMTIFYNGLVCVYDDVAPEKAQAIMLLAGNGNTRKQHQVKPVGASNEVTTKNTPMLNPAAVPTDLSGSSNNGAVRSSSNIEATAANQPSFHQKSIPTSTDLCSPSSTGIVKPSTGVLKPVPPGTPVDIGPSRSPVNSIDVKPKNLGPKYLPPPICTAGPNQFRFSQTGISVDPATYGMKNLASKFTPSATGSAQFRFSQSALPIDPGLAGACSSKPEPNPTNQSPKIQGPAAPPAGSNRIRFSQSMRPIDSSSSGTSTNTAEASPRNQASRLPSPPTGSTQFRFSQSVPPPIDQISAVTPSTIVESNPLRPSSSNFPTSASGSNHFLSSRQPPTSHTPFEQVSPYCSTTTTTPEAPLPKPATNQLRFSQPGVPLARKSSIARFLEKRKGRVDSVAPYTVSKNTSDADGRSLGSTSSSSSSQQ